MPDIKIFDNGLFEEIRRLNAYVTDKCLSPPHAYTMGVKYRTGWVSTSGTVGLNIMSETQTEAKISDGKEDEVNCKDIIANHLIVENEEFDFDRVRNLWSLETIGINPDNEVSLSDKEILKSFERNTVYTNKRYETDCCGMKL
ncbi:integrase catalytic domain-containing protein [Trichonephila clavipes]|uniref:Integrase catalytic domain-containing protein n=1 Tax=Trichonephila clavipes TaxID=2585209 RepID=A0A8X6WFE7_TRICX|nr:integrase catalytic domain-containing protein [Trichonephila clavipes]